MLGLQVIDEEKQMPIGMGKSLMRNFPLLIPFMPIIIAFNLLKGKRWGDGFAETRVIWTKYKDRVPFSESVLGPYPPSSGVPAGLLVIFLVIFSLLASISIPTLIKVRKRIRDQQDPQYVQRNP